MSAPSKDLPIFSETHSVMIATGAALHLFPLSNLDFFELFLSQMRHLLGRLIPELIMNISTSCVDLSGFCDQSNMLLARTNLYNTIGNFGHWHWNINILRSTLLRKFIKLIATEAP